MKGMMIFDGVGMKGKETVVIKMCHKEGSNNVRI